MEESGATPVNPKAEGLAKARLVFSIFAKPPDIRIGRTEDELLIGDMLITKWPETDGNASFYTVSDEPTFSFSSEVFGTACLLEALMEAVKRHAAWQAQQALFSVAVKHFLERIFK